MKKILAILLACLLIGFSAIGQNTVGLISISPDEVSKGYNLIYPHNQPNVYLLNECGQIVHQWKDDENFRPGNTAYILKNSNLLKTKRPTNISSDILAAGGAGGIIELKDWDNNLLWSAVIMDSLRRAHHDIAPMPNGNVLIILWERKLFDELVENGRDTSVFNASDLWPEAIIEMDPMKDSVVWEWHVWDHIIQEYDSTKKNFGLVMDHPELIDINFELNGQGARGDWMHANAIDYHPELDQILISIPYFDEVWIIDHSTTIEEAKSHSGGNFGKGGDLLYRWGNPRTYKKGTRDDQTLFFQHDAQWINEFSNPDGPYYGKIAVFNNRAGENYSTANVFTPSIDMQTRSYNRENGIFLPEKFDLTLTHPDTFSMYSPGMSSVQFLENDNVLINVGRTGYSFEFTPDNRVIWEYINPLLDGYPVSQGHDLAINDNVMFRMDRYPLDYPAFKDKNLSNQGYIELNPVPLKECEFSTSTFDLGVHPTSFSFGPNPVNNTLYLNNNNESPTTIEIFSQSGQFQYKLILKNKVQVDVSQWPSGLYFINDHNNPANVARILVIH